METLRSVSKSIGIGFNGDSKLHTPYGSNLDLVNGRQFYCPIELVYDIGTQFLGVHALSILDRNSNHDHVMLEKNFENRPK